MDPDAGAAGIADMNDILIIAGIILAGWGLRSWGHPIPRKTGALLYLVASYVAGWRLTGSHAGGAMAVASWFLLPWLEIILRVRRMRLPIEKRISHRFPPPRDEFPQLRELTEELEAEGFEKVDDAGWDWDEVRHFVRVFYHAPSRTQAVIHLSRQRRLSVVYVSLTSRTTESAGNLTLTTWNYPFSSTMRQAPKHLLHGAPDVQSFPELIAEHNAFLSIWAVNESDLLDMDVGGLTGLLEEDLRMQIEYNLASGILQKAGPGTIRYSWRGCFYLWRQFVKDMVKFA